MMRQQRHLYVSDPKVVDVSKMRETAQRLSKGNKHNSPQTVTIHFHRHGAMCLDRDHEYYEAATKEVK